MSKFLDFEDKEKGYKLLPKTKANIKNSIGKKVCYVLSKDYDQYRGYFTVRYATISGTHYSNIHINGFEDTIDFRDILEIGIKIDD